MYVTLLLVILLIICMIVAYNKKDDFRLIPFDKDTNLPLRGLMALLIILSHIGQKTDIAIIENFDSIKYDIGAQIVALFFFISGYGLCRSYTAKRKLYIKGFLKKRLSTILPKFIFLTVGTVLVLHYLVDIDIAEQFSALYKRGITPLPHSWFIFAIIYVYLAFYFCALTNRSPKKVANLFVLSNFGYIIVMMKVLQFYPYWWMTILSVNLGVYVAIYESMISDFIRHRRLATYFSLIILLAISLCILNLGLLKSSALHWGIVMLWYLIQAMSGYVIVRTLGFPHWKWLSYFGLISLDLYLVHGIPLKIADSAGLDDWNLLLVTYMLVIPAAIILNRLFDREYMSELYKRIKSYCAKSTRQE